MDRNEAIKVIINNWPEGRPQLSEALQTLIPELKKSDDEKIRKTLKSFFDSEISDYGNVEWRNGIWYGEIVAWLKKQGEKIDTIENFNTEFEKQVSHLIASAINKEHEYNQSYVKWTANALLNYAKHELEKQGEQPNKVSIWKHWKDGIAGNGEGKLIYLIKKGNSYSLSSCLGYECDYILLSDLDKLMLQEKQGEQKSANKTNPKFKVGDWIYHEISGNTFHINKIENGLYVSDEGATISLGRQNDWRLWTIQDAKDGDIIFSNDNHGTDSIELIKSISDNRIKFWFCLSSKNNFKDCYYEISNGDIPYTNFASRKKATPTTKEQRDLLFQKMKEAGYEWNTEKKELKKIKEQNPTEDTCKLSDCDKVVNMTEYNNGYKCGEQRVLKYPEDYGLCKKPAWSEEDEKKIELLIAILEVNHPNGQFKVNPINTLNMEVMSTKELVDWLKSLKERLKGE